MKQPPAPIPNIDLGAHFKVIDDSVMPPRWKTLATGYATPKKAQQVIREYHLDGIWVFDFCGDRYYVGKTTEHTQRMHRK